MGTAVKWGVWRRMNNTGQCCVAAKRFIVHETIADTFLERFRNELRGVGSRWKQLDGRGYFLEPTILTDITPENPAFHVKFFAPVALVFRVQNEKEAIDLVEP
jgi:succinate-semialdehyde dehydrogenase/glutarate-semialdehyde dehydrogenase